MDQGKTAMEAGRKTILALNNVFAEMNDNFKNVRNELDKESNLIQVLYDEFTNINDDISNIASILEENSAHLQEISARTEMQFVSTQEATSEVKEIESLGQQLNKMVNES